VGYRAAQVVVGPENHVGGLRGFEHFPGVAQRKGQGFLAQDMFAGGRGCDGLVTVQLVGRADVNHVDARIAQELAEVIVRLVDAIL
jgi:hypothetical protein